MLPVLCRSGPTAYINADVAYPLRYDKITPAATDMQLTNLDKKSFNNYFEGELWAQPSVEHLKQLMRRVGRDGRCIVVVFRCHTECP